MSILIKDMEMPTSCETCAFSRLSNTRESIYCGIDYDTVPWGDGLKSENCPLILIPPHGRLIDADTLKADGFDSNGKMYISNLQIFHAPTIIPAEEAKHE